MGPQPSVLSREGLIALLGAVLLSMALWPGVWFGGRSMYSTDGVLVREPWASEAQLAGDFPHNPELGDHDLYIFPQLAFIQRHWHETGEFPLWNPATYAGVPLDGNPQVALLYPFHLALALFQEAGEPFSAWRLSLGLTWMGVLRFLLCAVFGYFWLRRAGGRRVSAALGAVFVAAGPYASLWRLHTPEQVYSMFPVALYFVEGILRGRVRVSMAGMAIAFGVSNLGGYPQCSLYFGLFAVAYALLRAPPEQRLAGLVRVGLAGLLAGLLAAPTWWATLEYLSQAGITELRAQKPLNPRGTPWWQVAVCGVLAWTMLWVVRRTLRRMRPGAWAAVLAGAAAAAAALLATVAGGDGQQAHLVVANVSGHPVFAPPFAAVSGQPAFIEVNQDHIGGLFLVLLLAGSDLVPGRRLLLVVSLLVAGSFPLLYQVVRQALPLVWTSRAACVVPLAVAFLFVACSERLAALPAEERAARLSRAAAGVLAFTALSLVSLPLRSGRLYLGYQDTAALVLVLSCALLPLRSLHAVPVLASAAALFAIAPTWGFQPSLEQREVYPATETVRFLQEETRKDPDLRIAVFDPGIFDGNSLLVHGQQQCLGWDGMDPRDYVTLVNYLVQFEPRLAWQTSKIEWLGSPLFDVFAARLVVARSGATFPSHFRIVRESKALLIAENPRAAPRAYLTAASFVMEDDAARRHPRLFGHAVTEHVGLQREENPALEGSPMRRGRARIHRRKAGELVVHTDADGAAYLVVLDDNLAGWEVEIDGEPGTIHRAFTAFRCVVLAGGRHVVRFVYRPFGFRCGLVLLGVGMAMIALLLVNAIRRRIESPGPTAAPPPS